MERTMVTIYGWCACGHTTRWHEHGHCRFEASVREPGTPPGAPNQIRTCNCPDLDLEHGEVTLTYQSEEL